MDIPNLNHRPAGSARWLLLTILSVGLVYVRLATIYARPLVLPPSVVSAAPPRREDAELFERALAAGLLRPDAAGRIAVAPSDLLLRRLFQREHPELLTPRHDQPDWISGPWDETVRRLHQALHFSAAGRYVRQQIDRFNARRPAPLTDPPGGRQAQWVGAGLIEIGRDE